MLQSVGCPKGLSEEAWSRFAYPLTLNTGAPIGPAHSIFDVHNQ